MAKLGCSYSRLHLKALVITCVAMAPFTPFFTEVVYQNLRKASSKSEQSIHFCSFPSTTGERDERVERNVTRMMTIIDLARNIRERHSKALKTPLKEMVVVHPDSEFLEDITGKLKEYVMEEINVRSVTQCNDPMKYASLRAEPNFSVLGKKLGKDMGKVSNEVKKMTLEQVLAFEQSGDISFFGHCLTLDDIKVVRQFKRPVDVSEKEIDAAGDGDVLVILDLRADQSLIEAGVAREVVNRIQKLRKTAQLEPTDLINVYYEPVDKNSNTLEEILQSQDQYIRDLLGNSLLPKAAAPSDVVVICEESHTVHDMSFVIYIARCMLVSRRCRTMASSPPPIRRNQLRSCRQASALVSSCLPDAAAISALPPPPASPNTTGASAKPSPKMGDSSVEVTEESQPNARVGTEFPGVRREASGRYKDEGGRQKHLGTFDTKEQAVKARKDFVLKLELKVKKQLKNRKKKHPSNGILKEKEKACIALEQKRVVSAQENSSAAEGSTIESPEEEKRPLQKVHN